MAAGGGTMQRDLKGMLDGAVGGAIGTAAMSAVMLGAQKLGLMGKQPPEAIAEAALDAGGAYRRDERMENALATLLHFGFGAGVGALFGVLRRRLPPTAPAALDGIVFASLVWFTSYEGWVPALGILPPASDDRPGRPQSMLLAHVIFGAVLGGFVGRREMRCDR
jgi:hypothetical protein